MKVIILNGPPGCGKDTLADHLVYGGSGINNAEKREFKTRLFHIASAVAGITLGELIRLNSRETKNTKTARLPGGRSPREWLIYVSESMVKPTLGYDFFGQAAAEGLTRSGAVYVFADGGFKPEIDEIKNAVGGSNLLVLQITRPGHTFAGDSRQYIDGGEDSTTLVVDNDSDEQTFLRTATKLVSIWLNS
jgi:hypothetical protein